MERRPRTLVPVKAMPAGQRLMFGTFAMERIGVIADQERRANQSIRKIIGEAIRYTPPFVERVLEALEPAEDLIRHARAQRGGMQEAPSTTSYIDEQLAEKADRKLVGSTHHSDPGATARELARQVARILHPDAAVASPSVRPTKGAQDTLTRSRQAAEAGDVVEMQSLTLQSTPGVMLARVRSLLHRGHTFDQIAADNPTWASDMAVLHEMAYVQYGRNGSLDKPQIRKTHALRTPEAAEAEAERMKKRDDRLARIMAFSHIHSVFTQLQELNTVPVAAERLTDIGNAMEQAGSIVGGLDDFFERMGPWRQIPRLQSQLEDFIVAVPEPLVALTQQVIGEGDSESASSTLLLSVVEVKRKGFNYKRAIEEAASPQNQLSTLNSDKFIPIYREDNTIYKRNNYN